MQADGAAESPDARLIALAERFARTADVFGDELDDLALQRIDLRDVLALIVRVDLDAVVAVLQQDGHVAVGIGRIGRLDRGAVFVVLQIVVDPTPCRFRR